MPPLCATCWLWRRFQVGYDSLLLSRVEFESKGAVFRASVSCGPSCRLQQMQTHPMCFTALLHCTRDPTWCLCMHRGCVFCQTCQVTDSGVVPAIFAIAAHEYSLRDEKHSTHASDECWQSSSDHWCWLMQGRVALSTATPPLHTGLQASSTREATHRSCSSTADDSANRSAAGVRGASGSASSVDGTLAETALGANPIRKHASSFPVAPRSAEAEGGAAARLGMRCMLTRSAECRTWLAVMLHRCGHPSSDHVR